MPRKKTTTSPPIKSFQKEVEKALKHVKDPEWLGIHSLLAAPYSLAEYLREQKIDAADPYQRGKALQKLLRNTINTLGTENANLLRLYYLERWSEKETYTELLISKATFQRNRKKAISELGVSLNKRLKPALRAEVPRPRGNLLERNKLTTICLHTLKEGKSIGLTGSGGMGKTTVGQHIAAKMAPQPAFWFTFRLGLNDNLSSLIFALGSFLARQGASTLWAQLIADKGDLKMKSLLGLLRYDLGNSALKRPVLCFDEVDLLCPTELEGHATLLTFLESLKGLTPLLFIGQQLPLEVDMHHRLKNLSSNSIQLMLEGAKIQLSTGDLERIETYTQGNPRLIELFIGLHRAGESIESLLAELPGIPSVEFLLKRMWQRLNEYQKTMLFFLVPFRRAVPRDAWNQAGEQEALAELIERRLVQAPDFGQLELLPAFRSVIYKQLSGNNRKTAHLRAAKIRRERAEYTLAADHYLQAGEGEIAFRLWHNHQEQEINQGQAGAALTLLEKISIEQLKKKDQERLVLLQGNLLKITGQYEASQQALTSMKWETPVLEAQARRLEGDVAELKGELNEAAEAYFAVLNTTEKLLSEKAQCHYDLGWVARRQKDVDKAWRQAMLADYEATNLKGYVKEDTGSHDEARTYYEKALALSEEFDYEYGMAKTHNNLGRLFYKRSQFRASEEHLQKAYDLFKGRGQISSMASARVNQAMFLNLARQHQAAIAPAKEALRIFERLGEPWGRRVARGQLAQAYLGVSEFNHAEMTAQEVIEKEQGRGVYDARWVLGEVKFARYQYQEAIKYFELVITYAQEYDIVGLEGYAQRSLGKTYRAIGEKEAAKAAFDRAIELFEGLGMPNEVEVTRKVRTGE